jgi:uncharacterized membrane protein
MAIRVFVDGVWLHRYWGCHRMPERCFFVQGRQFHVCARCTGLLIGLPLSLILLPILFLPIRAELPFVFLSFAAALVIDGLSQYYRMRTSTNSLRFITGIGTTATFLPTLLAVFWGW